MVIGVSRESPFFVPVLILGFVALIFESRFLPASAHNFLLPVPPAMPAVASGIRRRQDVAAVVTGLDFAKIEVGQPQIEFVGKKNLLRLQVSVEHSP